MATPSFTISAAKVVPSNYSWDQGVPILSSLDTITPTVVTSNGVVTIVGYAPFVKVYFKNTSVLDNVDASTNNPYNVTQLITYNWNFNDYYNIATNIVSLSGNNNTTNNYDASHTFVMPGVYNASLQQIQTTLRSVGSDPTSPSTCYGDYDINWFWSNLELIPTISNAQNITNKTWDDYTSITATPKTWEGNQVLCLQKYCFNWNWYKLANNSDNPVTWAQAKSTGVYAKLWANEFNDTICQQPVVPHSSSITVSDKTALNNCIVQVLEIPPTANMFSLTNPLTGLSQLTVQLSPRNSVCGSFPIDRIDWNLGDGTPVKTVTRYSTPTDNAFTFTNVFSSDPLDVRNYDIVHTYYRTNTNTYPVFYPSLTCYSANTNTADSRCITIGPITLPTTPNSTHILKARNNDTGDNIYIFDVNQNITFFTTAPQPTAIVGTAVPNIPPTTIINSVSASTLYTGNNGDITIV